MSSNFHFLVPECLHTEFGSERHSSFWETPVLIFVCTRPLAKVKKWPWPSILTYLHKFNKMSAPSNFQVTCCNSFWNIHCFHFFLWKSLSYQIWSCCKIGQGQPRVIIWTNYDWAGVTDATFQVLWKSVRRFWRRRFLKGFNHIWAWRPSWSCDPHAANKLSSPPPPPPLPNEAPHKIWLWLAKRFQRRWWLEIVNDGRRRTTTEGRTPDHVLRLVFWDRGKYSEKSENIIGLDSYILNSLSYLNPI